MGQKPKLKVVVLWEKKLSTWITQLKWPHVLEKEKEKTRGRARPEKTMLASRNNASNNVFFTRDTPKHYCERRNYEVRAGSLWKSWLVKNWWQVCIISCSWETSTNTHPTHMYCQNKNTEKQCPPSRTQATQKTQILTHSLQMIFIQVLKKILLYIIMLICPITVLSIWKWGTMSEKQLKFLKGKCDISVKHFKFNLKVYISIMSWLCHFKSIVVVCRSKIKKKKNDIWISLSKVVIPTVTHNFAHWWCFVCMDGATKHLPLQEALPTPEHANWGLSERNNPLLLLAYIKLTYISEVMADKN